MRGVPRVLAGLVVGLILGATVTLAVQSRGEQLDDARPSAPNASPAPRGEPEAPATFVAWVPFVSLIAVPMTIAAWLVRGLVFQYVGLTALAAYQTQYRRFTGPDSRPLTTPLWVQRA